SSLSKRAGLYSIASGVHMWQPSRADIEMKMHQLLKQEAKETEIQIESQDIYDWLVIQGVTPREGEMESVFNSFKRDGLIKGVGFAANGDERKRHGNFRITRVSKWL